MRITYYALKPLLVGDDLREPGDLVPEAADWRYLSGFVSDCKLAPVLVATLPEEQQITLLEWEEARVQEALGNTAPVSAPPPADSSTPEEAPVPDPEPEPDDEPSEPSSRRTARPARKVK